MKLLIVEDEPQQALGLSKDIASWYPQADLKTVEEKEDIRRELAEGLFDIAVLDILIAGEPVFQFLPEQLDGQQLLFVTGSDRYMQHAFQCYAVDYIMKPYEPVRLRQSLQRAVQRVEANQQFAGGQWPSLLRSIRERRAECLALPMLEGIELVRLDDIIAIEAQRSYCSIHLLCGAQKLVSRSLSWAEALLIPEGFMRPHRSWLVNPKHVRAFLKHQGYSLRMVNGLLVQVAEQAKERVADWLRGFSTGA